MRMPSSTPLQRNCSSTSGALILPACNDEQIEAALKALGEGCLIDTDCEGDLVCVFRRCHHECETDKDCADKQPCTLDACTPSGCTHTPIPGCCTTDAQCDDGLG